MMGQSNMAGMAIVESQDTVTNPRIYKWWNTQGWMSGQESFSQPYFGPCGFGGQCLDRAGHLHKYSLIATKQLPLASPISVQRDSNRELD